MHIYTFSNLYILTGTYPLSTANKAISLPYSLPSPLTQLLAQSTGTPSLSHGRTSLSIEGRRTTRSPMIYRRSHRSCSMPASR